MFHPAAVEVPLAAVVADVWQGLRVGLKSRGLLGYVDEHRAAGYVARVGACLIERTTGDRLMAERCAQHAMRLMAAGSVHWRPFGYADTLRSRWLTSTLGIVEQASGEWSCDLLDEGEQLCLWRLAKAVAYIQKEHVQLQPDEASEMYLVLLQAITHSAPRRIAELLEATHTPRAPRPNQPRALAD